MDLATDFKEFVELLNKHEVRYLVVGGYAVAVYGHPRYTKDLDIWIEASNKNSDQLLAALDELIRQNNSAIGLPPSTTKRGRPWWSVYCTSCGTPK